MRRRCAPGQEKVHLSEDACHESGRKKEERRPTVYGLLGTFLSIHKY